MREIIWLELLISAVLVLATFAIHAVGMIFLTRLVRREAREKLERQIDPASPEGILLVLVVIAGLFALHAAEILLYALTFLGLGAIGSLAGCPLFLGDDLRHARLQRRPASSGLAPGGD